MFIVHLTYIKPLAEIEAALVEHRAFLDRHYASNDFLCSGPKNPRDGGIILARTADRQTLENILANDPFQQRGLATYELIEFVPVKWSTAFGECL